MIFTLTDVQRNKNYVTQKHHQATLLSTCIARKKTAEITNQQLGFMLIYNISGLMD